MVHDSRVRRGPLVVFVEGSEGRVDGFVTVLKASLSSVVVVDVEPGEKYVLEKVLSALGQVALVPRFVVVRGYAMSVGAVKSNEWFSMERWRCVLCSVDGVSVDELGWCVLDVLGLGEYSSLKRLKRMADSSTDQWRLFAGDKK